ncbi:S53 family peptidase [Streptomyces sp. NPDC006632]|uniref:S53 family peptidase n=1 Tax=unclassified Streptomyces TaxID=2593676 RepID=UPI002E1F1AA5
MRRTLSPTALAATLAAAALALATPLAQAATGPSTAAHVTTVRSCAAPTRVDVMACKALKVTGGTVASAHTERSLTGAAAPSGLGPSSLQSAYKLPSSTAGSGRTVAIVDAYDDPNAAADLAKYRSQYGLPACTVANGCFKKVGQTGTSTLPGADAGWAEEISLDLDMVSAACPNCKILLVEAKSASMANLGTAVNTAVSLGAKYVSNSYGGGESSSDTSYDSQYFNHPGVAITVSSGDGGYGTEYPAASRYVTAVGGTSLKTASNSRGWTESVWSGAGSGCSAYDAKPSWQKDTGCSKRTVADVSAVADPATGVAVYDTYGGDPGWEVFGGTSASSPLIAAVYALAGVPSSGSTPASFPYAHTGSLNDVTSGSNGSCSPAYLCKGGSGYDGPSGLGTPNGTAAFTG